MRISKFWRNIRKIEVLEKLPFEEWTKDELIEVIINFSLYKCACNLEHYINTIPEYVRVGIYKRNQNELEEYKITDITDEMKEELPFSEWTRQELIKFVNKYNKHYDNWWG